MKIEVLSLTVIPSKRKTVQRPVREKKTTKTFVDC